MQEILLNRCVYIKKMDSHMQRLWQQHNQIIRLTIVAVVLILIFLPFQQFYGLSASTGSNNRNKNVNVQQQITQSNKCKMAYECVNNGKNTVNVGDHSNSKIQIGQHISQNNQCGQGAHCINNANNNVHIKSNNVGHLPTTTVKSPMH